MANDRARRKQKNAAKRKRRAKKQGKKQGKKRALEQKRKAAAKKGPSEREFPEAQYLFWMAHGCNYLASNYDEGVWDPLFPGIYEGNLVAPEQVAQRILKKYEKKEGKKGIEVLAWTVQGRKLLYAYYKQVLQHLAEKKPDGDAEDLIRQPHNGIVWGWFQEIHNMLKKRREYREASGGGIHDEPSDVSNGGG